MMNDGVKSVGLYGHLVYDSVVVGNKCSETLGGIANVWNGLKRLKSCVDVKVVPLSVSHALIMVDKKINKRVANCCHNIVTFEQPEISDYLDWHHIAYINELPDPSFVKNIKRGMVSADITKENPEKCVDFLNYIDFLFIAEEDMFCSLDELAKMTKGWVICHSPYGSISTNGKTKHRYKLTKNMILNDVNIIGAGDYLAASFIDSFLSRGLGRERIYDLVISAHKKTTILLHDNG